MSGPVEDLQREDNKFCLVDSTGIELTRTAVLREAHRLSQTLHDLGLRGQESVLILGASTVFPGPAVGATCCP